MDAQASVKQQAFYMHKGIESDNLKEALTCASSLLGELRTGKLQPQRYFELYMQVNM
jgi:vacuolar protein sorting-associated protein 35